MTAATEVRIEVQRLARVLAVAPGDLDPLGNATDEDLRELREAISDRLLDRSRGQLNRAVALADRIPGALAAKLTQHAMGPVLAARAAALVSPERAADLARRLPPAFLADVACHMDLRSIERLMGGLEPETILAAAADLREREEWLVLGTFAGHLSPDVLTAVTVGFDGEAIAETILAMDEPESVIAGLTEVQRAAALARHPQLAGHLKQR